MTFNNFKMTIQIFVNSIILISLFFSCLYKISSLSLNTNYLDSYLMVVTIIAIIAYILKFIVMFKFENNKVYQILFSIIDSILILYIILINNYLIWPYFIICLYLINNTVVHGKMNGFIGLGLSALIMGVDIWFYDIIVDQTRIFELSLIFIMQVFIVCICMIISENNKIINNKLVISKKKIEEKISTNNKISNELDELKQYNEDIEIANKRLETTNQKLNKSAAEYYTLQQISQAIATILDIEELLKFINDVIIGVMGANYSSILLIDKETRRMSVKVTNIIPENLLDNLNDNINCESLIQVSKTGKALVDNNVKNEYVFTKGRNVKSLLCVPLFRKKGNFGLVLLEQDREDAFSNEHLKFMLSISNQMSIALENVSLYEKMQRMATIDALTNIHNRLYFNQRIAKELANGDQENYPISVCIFDIDYFKKFNDTYGHIFGDLVLKTIAKLAKDNIREQDVVARFGGEEFVIIMPNTTIDQSYQMIEDLRKRISDYQVKDGAISASVTASFGIACYPEHGTNEAQILRNADEAMYISKECGRNQTQIFEIK